MSAVPLAPKTAVEWLRSLSVDLLAVAVIDSGGALLAGDARLAARLAEMPSDPPAGDPRHVPPAGPGPTCAPDSGGAAEPEPIVVASARHTVAAVLGPRALRRLSHADLQAALEALDGA